MRDFDVIDEALASFKKRQQEEVERAQEMAHLKGHLAHGL